MANKWQCGECQTDLNEDGQCPNKDCRSNRLKWSNKTGSPGHPEDEGDRK